MQTYLEQYDTFIAPKLQELDLFLKTTEPPYAVGDIAICLDSSDEEIQSLLQKFGFGLPTKGVFLYLIQLVKSPICKLIQREIACGMPPTYTIEEISYIYDLEIEKVQVAAQNIGKETFTKKDLVHLFSYIYC
ncbi:hypothetical protein [Chakrabartyella piscis]|uniref:hypothetical protein n=1 Tax=Chakrabartyella piscis TaxID=2918914 RepID=UPI0029586DC2|nr:hypothetical protein [Chakrabartyella piscis]